MTDRSDPTSSVSTGNPFADVALDYVRRGWRVIELHRMRVADGTCSCGTNCGKSAGKHPRNNAWQKTAPMTERDVFRIWKPGNTFFANIGIATGAPSGFWVLDVDPDNGGDEQLKRLQADHTALTAGRIVRTGSGGWHLYFTLPDDFEVTNSPGRLQKQYGKGLDIRGTGGQVVAPPSVSGKGAYAVLKDEPINPAPDWLLDLIRPENREETTWKTTASDAPSVTAPSAAAASTTSDAATAASSSSLDQSPDSRLATYARNAWEGELKRLDDLGRRGWDGEPWDATTYEVACNLTEIANADWTPFVPEDVGPAVYARAPRDEGFDDARVIAKVNSARSKVGSTGRPAPVLTAAPEAAAPLAGPDARVDPLLAQLAASGGAPEGVVWPMRTWDDLGNAHRLVDHYGAVLRWVEEADKWAHWTGTRWELVAQVRHLVHEMLHTLKDTEAQCYSDELGEDDDPKKGSERTRFMKFVAQQRMSSKISACLREAASLTELQASLSDFDRYPMLLNVANGVVDLATGALLPSDPRFMLMQQSPVAYDPHAAAPLWMAFLERTQPDLEMRAYLQRVTGYSITGMTGEQAMFLHHGTGANGKSVYLRACALVTGDYGQTVPRSTLLTSTTSGDRHPTDIARMVGRRFLQVSETAAGRRLDEEVVKGLTGGEKQTARFMGKDYFDFTPTGKIHYVTNHLPRLSDAESIWRRLHLIGWRVTIPNHEIDPHLGDKLEAEAAGILAWMVRGAVDWTKQRLRPPTAAHEDLSAYRADQDEFGEFIATTLTTTDAAVITSADDLYNAYQGWAWRNGIRRLIHGPDFGKILVERGYPRVRRGHWRGFRGVAVNPAATQASPSTGELDDMQVIAAPPAPADDDWDAF